MPNNLGGALQQRRNARARRIGRADPRGKYAFTPARRNASSSNG
jgi:hypothetical protein